MIIVTIKGGLGNQLFQYALGRSLKKENDAKEVVYDTSFYNTTIQKFPRDLLLKKFICAENGLTVTDKKINPNLACRMYKKLRKKGIVRRLPLPIQKLFYMAYLQWGNMIEEQAGLVSNQYIKTTLLKKKISPIHVDGYWSDIRLFQKILPEISKELQLTERSTTFNQLVTDINEHCTLLHVRRGDYLTLSDQKDGIFLGLDYYKKAIAKIKSEQKKEIWVFTDDYDWCKKNLPENFPDQYFNFKAENLNDEESFELMRYFPTNIIANSTYSLWAAHLNYTNIKEVYYPVSWSNNIKRGGVQIIPDNQLWIGL